MDVIDGSVDVFSFPMNGTAIGYQRCVIIIEFLFFLGGGGNQASMIWAVAMATPIPFHRVRFHRVDCFFLVVDFHRLAICTVRVFYLILVGFY